MKFNHYILFYIIIISIISYFIMLLDKNKAKKGRYRISEKTLLALSIIGGSIGTLLGMYNFHHKTRKALFKYGVPIIIVLQVIIYTLLFYGNNIK